MFCFSPIEQNPWGWDFSGSSNMEELQILLEESIMIRFVTTNRFTGDSSGFLKGSEFIDFLIHRLSEYPYLHIFILAKTIHLRTFSKNGGIFAPVGWGLLDVYWSVDQVLPTRYDILIVLCCGLSY